MFPEAIRKFIDSFSQFPGIGPRQATRLAFYLISRGSAVTQEAYEALSELSSVTPCPQCFFVKNGDSPLCSICSDTNRDANVFLIVEKETDLISIERTKSFHGHYCVLGELTKSGVLETSHKLRLEVLKSHIATLPSQKAEEIIIGLNPGTYGDLVSSLISKELAPHTETITKLGRGIPTGGEIEFADEETLSQAVIRRSK